MALPKLGANFGHHGHRCIDRPAVVDQAHFLATVQLEGVETDRLQLADAGDDIGRPVAADPAVHLHAVAHQAAEQLRRPARRAPCP